MPRSSSSSSTGCTRPSAISDGQVRLSGQEQVGRRACVERRGPRRLADVDGVGGRLDLDGHVGVLGRVGLGDLPVGRDDARFAVHREAERHRPGRAGGRRRAHVVGAALGAGSGSAGRGAARGRRRPTSEATATGAASGCDGHVGGRANTASLLLASSGFGRPAERPRTPYRDTPPQVTVESESPTLRWAGNPVTVRKPVMLAPVPWHVRPWPRDPGEPRRARARRLQRRRRPTRRARPRRRPRRPPSPHQHADGGGHADRARRRPDQRRTRAVASAAPTTRPTVARRRRLLGAAEVPGFNDEFRWTAGTTSRQGAARARSAPASASRLTSIGAERGRRTARFRPGRTGTRHRPGGRAGRGRSPTRPPHGARTPCSKSWRASCADRLGRRRRVQVGALQDVGVDGGTGGLVPR